MFLQKLIRVGKGDILNRYSVRFLFVSLTTMIFSISFIAKNPVHCMVALVIFYDFSVSPLKSSLSLRNSCFLYSFYSCKVGLFVNSSLWFALLALFSADSVIRQSGFGECLTISYITRLGSINHNVTIHRDYNVGHSVDLLGNSRAFGNWAYDWLPSLALTKNFFHFPPYFFGHF